MCGTHMFRYLSEVGKSRRSHPESGRYRKDTKSDYLTKLMFVVRNKFGGGVGCAPGLENKSDPEKIKFGVKLTWRGVGL